MLTLIVICKYTPIWMLLRTAEVSLTPPLLRACQHVARDLLVTVSFEVSQP